MADVMKIAQWNVDFEQVATANAYGAVEPGADCTCDPCRNFQKLGYDVFTPTVHKLLSKLGIDYTKPAEIYHQRRLDSGRHRYGGWYHFVGEILTGADSNRRLEESGVCAIDTVLIEGDAHIGLSASTDLVGRSFEGLGLAQLEFEVVLPWVLDLPEPE